MGRKANKHPSEGIRDAHRDFICYLYAAHNDAFDEGACHAELMLGMPREKIAYALAALVALYLIIGAAAQIVCNFIGFAYPAYASVKAVRTKQTDDDTQWLVYWCVFATFSLIDFFAGSIMQWFPFYWLLKAIFLIFLYLPQTMGAQFLFDMYVDPLVTAIDECRSKTKKEK